MFQRRQPLGNEFQKIDASAMIRIWYEKTASLWLTMLFKFRRAILNLKKCIINYVTLKSAAAVTMKRVGVWMGRNVPDSRLIFFFSYSNTSWWEISTPIFTILRQILCGCSLMDGSNLPYETQQEC